MSKGNSTWFPLASEKTLHELYAGDAIDIDSFTYVVYAHYVQALGEQLDLRLLAEEASKEFWRSFSRVAAAASLGSLLTPESAPAAPVLRASSWAADLVLLANTVWSTWSELQRINRLEGQALAEESSALEAFGQLGDLLAVRRDILEGLADDAIVVLLTTLVGMKDFQLTRRALLAHSYYQDLDTLLAPNGGPES